MIITATAAAAAAVMGLFFKVHLCPHWCHFCADGENVGGWGMGGGWFDSVSISVLPLIRAVFYT